MVFFTLQQQVATCSDRLNRRGKLSPSQCTKHPSVPSIGCVRIADLIQPHFKNEKLTLNFTFEKPWEIRFCT